MANRVHSTVGTPAEIWPLTYRAMAVNQGAHDLGEKIFALPEVKEWIFHPGKDGPGESGEVPTARWDRRACSLLTAVSNFKRNAQQPWQTPAEISKHNEALADDAERLSKRVAHHPAPAMQQYAADLGRLAQVARKFAAEVGSGDGDHRWSLPHANDETGRLNDFLRHLCTWLRDFDGFHGEPHFTLVADIGTALYPSETARKTISAASVRELMRPPRRRKPSGN